MYKLLFWQTAAMLAGFLIDCITGDPAWLPHPVMAIGKLISFLDKKLRRGEAKRDLRRGVLTVFAVCLVSAAVPAALLYSAWAVSEYLYFALSAIMCWQLIAPRQLARESGRVMRRLQAGDLPGARKAVSNIVGRDTDVLDEKGVCRAAVETVAENASDGVAAPVFYILFFGAVGGFLYKAVNTMDSMLGYKNEKYLYFGRAAAKTDDVFNFIPSRLCAWLMILACPLVRLNAKNALRIFRRDRFNHASPNSAQTESVCAGALGVRLAGDAVYGGKVCEKKYIGDADREIRFEDIKRVNRLMYAATGALLLLFVCLRVAAMAVVYYV